MIDHLFKNPPFGNTHKGPVKKLKRINKGLSKLAAAAAAEKMTITERGKIISVAQYANRLIKTVDKTYKELRSEADTIKKVLIGGSGSREEY